MYRNRLVTALAVTLAAAMLMTGCGNDTGRSSDEVITDERDADGMVHLENADEVSAFFEEIYGTVGKDQLPMGLSTTELDINDADAISYHTGLTDLTGIDSIYLSESMVGSIAYSAVYITTNEEADAQLIRQTVFDNVNPSKWICVTAEKEIAANFGADVFFVMGSSDTVDLVYTAAVKAAQNRNMIVSDEILEKTNPM